MIPDWAGERRTMIRRHLRGRDIHDLRVLAAMLEIPREQFVPLERRLETYRDEPLGIGFGQTISQPYMTAWMAQCLELKGTERVLEIGAGSGYHAAVLARLAAQVVTVEIVPHLAELARRNLDRAGCGSNVCVVCADGSEGFAEEAPYQAISVAAAAPEVPYALLEQLDDPGRLVIPVGPLDDQELLLVIKSGGKVERRSAGYCRFVLFRGDHGWK